MADKTIGQLTPASQVTPTDLFVLEQSGTAKKLTGQILENWLVSFADGHGGIQTIEKTGTSGLTDTYTITLADTTTMTFTVTNGKGIQSIATYWAVSSNGTTPPTNWSLTRQSMTSTNRYLWSHQTITYNDGSIVNTTSSVVGVYGDKGDTGNTGVGISTLTQTARTPGVSTTYTFTMTDGSTKSFISYDGVGIADIAYTSSSGLIDTYTVTMTNGDTDTFTVTNAKSITSVAMVSGTHAPGTTDTYRITFNDGDTTDFTVYNGTNGTGSVSAVDGIQAVNQNVPLLLTGNGAPTVSTVGQLHQRYFDLSSHILYICTGIDNSGSVSTYSWAGTGVPVDSALSSTSQNPVQNAVITGKVGTATLTTTANNLSGAVNELNAGKYAKPSGGIPKSDLTSAVQTSLDNADSALEIAGDGQLSGFESANLTGAVNELGDRVLLTMDSVAVGSVAYKDLFFGSYSVISMLYLDSGTFAPFYVNAGTPTIVNSSNNVTLHHNLLKAFGTSSQQLTYNKLSVTSGHSYYSAMLISVPRYSAGDCGIVHGESSGLGNVTLQRATTGFELLSGISAATNTSATVGAFVGTANSANADCYIACPVVIDITAAGLQNSAETKELLDKAFLNYVSLTDSPEFIARRIEKRKPKIATAVMDQTSDSNRFSATKQLCSIARKKLVNPYYVPKAVEYDWVAKGCVCELPEKPELYEKANLDLLFGINETSTAKPCSTVKVLNAATALYYGGFSMNDKYSIESGDIISGDSSNTFQVGDTLTIRDILFAMMLPSANTCANALGTFVGRKIKNDPSASNTSARDTFVYRMKRRMYDIGNVEWTGNASGYSNETLRPIDILRILIDGATHPGLAKIWNKKTYTLNIGGSNSRVETISTTVTNTSFEQEYYIMGGKTGTGTGTYALILISEPLTPAI